eukprot:UN18549
MTIGMVAFVAQELVREGIEPHPGPEQLNLPIVKKHEKIEKSRHAFFKVKTRSFNVKMPIFNVKMPILLSSP